MFCQQYAFRNDKNKNLYTNIDNAGWVSLNQGGVVVMVKEKCLQSGRIIDSRFNDQGGTAICLDYNNRVH